MSETLAGRRESRSATEVARILRTRQRLAQAFRNAVDAQLADITVTGICERAGIARSTFYTHFATVEDLAVSTVSELFTEVAAPDLQRRTARAMSRPEITRLALHVILGNLWDSRQLVRYTIEMGSKPAIQEGLVAKVAAAARNIVMAELPDLDDADVGLHAEFMAAGTVAVALRWIAEPDGVSQNHILEQLIVLLPSWLTTDPQQAPRLSAGTVPRMLS